LQNSKVGRYCNEVPVMGPGRRFHFPDADNPLDQVLSAGSLRFEPVSSNVVNQTFTIRVLGEFEILKGKTPQAFPQSRKTRALLAYLILTGRRHRRERLCDLLWDLPDDPRASLRWSLSRLRSLVDHPGHERIVADREYVFFDPKGATVDLLEIRRELAPVPMS